MLTVAELARAGSGHALWWVHSVKQAAAGTKSKTQERRTGKNRGTEEGKRGYALALALALAYKQQ